MDYLRPRPTHCRARPSRRERRLWSPRPRPRNDHDLFLVLHFGHGSRCCVDRIHFRPRPVFRRSGAGQQRRWGIGEYWQCAVDDACCVGVAIFLGVLLCVWAVLRIEASQDVKTGTKRLGGWE